MNYNTILYNFLQYKYYNVKPLIPGKRIYALKGKKWLVQ